METRTPPRKDLLEKLIELEETQKHLKQDMSWVHVLTELRQRSHSSAREAPAWRESGDASFRIQDSRDGNFTDKQYLNVLQSMGTAVHVFDVNMRIIFWNAMAEKLYGYSAAEIVGKNPINLIVDDRDIPLANIIIQRCLNGESWTGEFPLKSKSGESFSAVTTCSPFCDDDASFIGFITITRKAARFLHPTISAAREGETSFIPARNTFASKEAVISKLGLESDQPIQVAIASKISSLASKVRTKVTSKMRAGDSQDEILDDETFSGASTSRGDFIYSPFGVFTYEDKKYPFKISNSFSDESDGKSTIHKVLTSKAEEWIAKKRLSWPWKGNEQESSKGKPTHSVWPWAQNEGEKEKSHQVNISSGVKSERHSYDSNKHINNEGSSSRSSSTNGNSRGSTSSYGSTNSSVMNKVDTDSDCLEYEILWDDLSIGDKISSKMRAGDSSVTLSKGGSEDSHHSDHGVSGDGISDDATLSGASTAREDFIHSPCGVFTYEYDDEKSPLKISQRFQ